MKRFIYKFINKFRSVYQKVKALRESDIDNLRLNRTLTSVLFDWLLELLLYGLVMSVVYAWIITGNWWLAPFALGAIRWLWLNLVKHTVDKIRGNQ